MVEISRFLSLATNSREITACISSWYVMILGMNPSLYYM